MQDNDFTPPGPGRWALDRSHFPGGTTPISQWLMEECMAAGLGRAFAEVGVLASFASPLAAAGVSLFTVSTFDTDYLLIKADRIAAAREALIAAGHALVDVLEAGPCTT